MEFTIIQGDIAAVEADAIVNAAGTILRMDSGVAGALRRAADGPINEAAQNQGPVGLGEVAVTDSYGLDCDLVIHAAAMPHFDDGQATEESIQTATRNALDCAETHDCDSLVLPILGTGAAGFDLAEGASILCEVIDQHDASSLTDVRVIAYTEAEYETVSGVGLERGARNSLVAI